jgi:hypothetical protein
MRKKRMENNILLRFAHAKNETISNVLSITGKFHFQGNTIKND